MKEKILKRPYKDYRDIYYLDQETLEKALKLGPPGDQGKIYSIFYEIVLDSLKRWGEIKDYSQTIQNSEDDSHGVDFWITTENGIVPISITGNDLDKQKRAQKCNFKIPVIAIRKKDKKETKSVFELKIETLTKISKYDKKYKR